MRVLILVFVLLANQLTAEGQQRQDSPPIRTIWFTTAPTISQIPVGYKETNEDALDGYRLGWATGDTDIIIGVVTDTFNFTWVPDEEVVSKSRFPGFFGDFKANAEADGRANYFMRFDNIIHRQIGDILYEAADWIVDDFDRGSYFNAAQDGKVIWDMATT